MRVGVGPVGGCELVEWFESESGSSDSSFLLSWFSKSLSDDLVFQSNFSVKVRDERVLSRSISVDEHPSSSLGSLYSLPQPSLSIPSCCLGILVNVVDVFLSLSGRTI